MSHYTLVFFNEGEQGETLTTKKEYSRSPNHMTLRRLAIELGSDAVDVYTSDRYGFNTELVKQISFDLK